MAFRDEKIEFYTVTEGGQWIEWPSWAMSDYVPTDEFLKGCAKNKIRDFNRRLFICVILGVQLHSFKTSKGRRWDCFNGWTKNV